MREAFVRDMLSSTIRPFVLRKVHTLIASSMQTTCFVWHILQAGQMNAVLPAAGLLLVCDAGVLPGSCPGCAARCCFARGLAYCSRWVLLCARLLLSSSVGAQVSKNSKVFLWCCLKGRSVLGHSCHIQQ